MEIADLPPSVRGEGTQEVEPPGLAEILDLAERHTLGRLLSAILAAVVFLVSGGGLYAALYRMQFSEQ